MDEFEWTEYDEGERKLFYGVRAKDVATQRARIETTVQLARRDRPSVVVFPELALTPDLLIALTKTAGFAELPLVIAGSYHEAVEGQKPGRNISVVFAHGKELHRHYKFSDFHANAGGGTRRHENLVRDANTQGFDVLIAPRATAVVMICKDVFDERIQYLLQHLAPNLVAVPAMSPDTDDFVALAERLARSPQALTLVACAVSPAGAIFGRPSHEPVAAAVTTVPVMVIFGLDGSHKTYELQ